ncbi:ABC transporter substrate-binding protein [Cellulosilyticum sp. ST5]|uniref:ABC transporter substrate-binding protein n=1 Tax=Cellulosilyticum sp. ST5 TaxID=3055805 RepID=UPI003977C0B6
MKILKKNFKKIVGISIACMWALTNTVGCSPIEAEETGANNAGSKPANEAGPSSQTTTQPASVASANATKLIFWHSMGGAGGEAINKLTEQFNASQNEIVVEAQFQGSYDEAINKLKSATIGDASPDIMQLYDIGTRWMIDSGYAYKIQDMINEDNYDVSKLEQNILAYYSINNELYSMPFNSSTPILYYNKDAFKEVGLDPEKAPTNLDEMIEVSKALVKKDGDKVTRYGANIQVYGWFFEQFLVKEQLEYANNGNGRTDGATAVSFDSNGGGLAIMNKWKEAVDSGVIANLGRDGDVNKEAFTSGNSCMFLGSTASLSGILSSIDGKFELGTAYFPSINASDKGGVSIGGGSLWMLDKKDDAKAKASWEFIKYMVSPEAQVEWSKATGYFPITTEAYNLPAMEEHLNEKPQFKTAIDQLHASTGSTGALLAVFPEARACIEENLEKLLNNEISAEQAVENSAGTINKAIEKYNKTK